MPAGTKPNRSRLPPAGKPPRPFCFPTNIAIRRSARCITTAAVEDLALQKARAVINERMHLRLWRTMKSFEGKEVWIGQVSRDIGVRFTFKTWNLTTHRIDEDVDEARDYVIDYLMSTGHVAQVGYVGGWAWRRRLRPAAT